MNQTVLLARHQRRRRRRSRRCSAASCARACGRTTSSRPIRCAAPATCARRSRRASRSWSGSRAGSRASRCRSSSATRPAAWARSRSRPTTSCAGARERDDASHVPRRGGRVRRSRPHPTPLTAVDRLGRIEARCCSLGVRWVRARCVPLVAAMLALQSTWLLASAALAQALDPKASLANGDKAARGEGLGQRRTSDSTPRTRPRRAATRSRVSRTRTTRAEARHRGLRRLRRSGSRRTARRRPPAKKKTAEARLKELAGRPARLTIDTSTKPARRSPSTTSRSGTTPLAAPLRLAAGPHRVRVTKDGFLAVRSGAERRRRARRTTVQVEARAADHARASSREGEDRQADPRHSSTASTWATRRGPARSRPDSTRSAPAAPGLAAPPQKVTVERGKTQDVELVAAASSATLKVGTSDGKGLIYLDDKLVGEGTFIATIPAGPHELRITREGYDPFEEEIDLKDKEHARAHRHAEALARRSRPARCRRRTERSRASTAASGSSGFSARRHEALDADSSATRGKPAELTSCDGGGGIGGGARRVHRLPLGSGRRRALRRRALRSVRRRRSTGDRRAPIPASAPTPRATKSSRFTASAASASSALRLTLAGREASLQRRRRRWPLVPLDDADARHDRGREPGIPRMRSSPMRSRISRRSSRSSRASSTGSARTPRSRSASRCSSRAPARSIRFPTTPQEGGHSPRPERPDDARPTSSRRARRSTRAVHRNDVRPVSRTRAHRTSGRTRALLCETSGTAKRWAGRTARRTRRPFAACRGSPGRTCRRRDARWSVAL